MNGTSQYGRIATQQKKQRAKKEIRDPAKFNSLVVDLHDMHTRGYRETCKINDEIFLEMKNVSQI